MLLDKDATITNLDPLLEPAAVKDEGSGITQIR